VSGSFGSCAPVVEPPHLGRARDPCRHGGGHVGRVLEAVLVDQVEEVTLIEDLDRMSGYSSRSRRTLAFFFVTSFWLIVVISM
jgi:hypothetical protein